MMAMMLETFRWVAIGGGVTLVLFFVLSLFVERPRCARSSVPDACMQALTPGGTASGARRDCFPPPSVSPGNSFSVRRASRSVVMVG